MAFQRAFVWGQTFNVDIALWAMGQNVGPEYSPFIYSGDVSANTQAQFNAISWEDTRTKPTWQDVLDNMAMSIDFYYASNTPNGTDCNLIFNQAMAAIALKSDLSHTHPQSDVTGLTTALAGKAATSHTHAQSAITNLVSDLSGINTAISGKANASHSHSQSDITNLTTALAGKANSPTDELYDHWAGTTQYQTSELRRYTNTATTDANGQVTFNLTANGLSGGTALFSNVLTAQATAVNGASTANQLSFCVIKSQTTTAVTFQLVRGTSTSIVVGGTVNAFQMDGAGVTVKVEVVGVKA